MTIQTTKKIIDELISEDPEANKELILFYQRKIKEAVIAAVEKGFKAATK